MTPKQKLESKLFNNLFEIELKEHYEDLYRFRDEEIELVTDIKYYSKPRRAATPTKLSTSNYFISCMAKSKRSTMTPGRFSRHSNSRK